jgi:HNH endonuclease
MGSSRYLAGLAPDQRKELQGRLHTRQSGRCYICDEPIDLVLHGGQLDIDHIAPLAADGIDAENNFALTHASCNRSKGASDLRVARRLAEFEKLQQAARERGDRGADRPMAYAAVERTFFRELLCKKALNTPIDAGLEDGTNPRELERDQMVSLMSLFADIFFVGRWDPEVGGRKLESRAQKGEKIPEEHLRAWRIAREEVLGNVMRWVRLVIENYFAYTGRVVKGDRLLQVSLPDELWRRIEAFLRNLSALPCWFDRNLSTTVFGPKQNLDYWEKDFETGKAPNGIIILTDGLDLNQMIQELSGQGTHDGSDS